MEQHHLTTTQPPRLQLSITCSPLLSSPALLSNLTSSGVLSPQTTLSFAPSSTLNVAKPSHLIQEAHSRPISSKQTLSLLSLLETMELEVTKEAERLQEDILQISQTIKQVVDEEDNRRQNVEKRRAIEARETRDKDDDFWLHA